MNLSSGKGGPRESWTRWRAVLLFLVLTAAVFTGGAVMGQQGKKNFYTPKDLNAELNIKVAFNDKEVFFRFKWPSESMGIYHDYLRYKGGKWVKTSGSSPGPHPLKLYEDRVSFLLDDGSVRFFDSAGGYVTDDQIGLQLQTDAIRELATKCNELSVDVGISIAADRELAAKLNSVLDVLQAHGLIEA